MSSKFKVFALGKTMLRKWKATDRTKKKKIINCLSDKRLVSRIYKELPKFKRKKTKQSKNIGKDLNRYFTEEDIQVANKLMKRYSKSLVIREMQIKSTMRYYCIPNSMAKISALWNKTCTYTTACTWMFRAVLLLIDKSYKQHKQGMDEQTMVYPYNEIFLSNKEEETTDTGNNMDKSQMHQDNWKKPASKGYLLYGSIHMTFGKRQNKNWELIINCPGLKGVEDLKVWLQRSGNKRKFYGRVIQLLHMLIVVKVTLQCHCPNSKNCSPKKVNLL